MNTEVIITILGILSTLITALITGCVWLSKRWREQRKIKHQREIELETLKKKYHTDIETLRAALLAVNLTEITAPPEMKSLLKALLEKKDL